LWSELVPNYQNFPNNLTYFLDAVPQKTSAAQVCGDGCLDAAQQEQLVVGMLRPLLEVPIYPTPYTLHPTPHTLHPTPYTLHPTPTPYTLHTGSGATGTRNVVPTSRTRKPEHETLKMKPGTRNPKPGTRNSERETRNNLNPNLETRTRDPKREARNNLDPNAETPDNLNPNPETPNLKPPTPNPKPQTLNQEHATGAAKEEDEDEEEEVRSNSNLHGARPVHQIISMKKWVQTSGLSIKIFIALRSTPTDVEFGLVWIRGRVGSKFGS